MKKDGVVKERCRLIHCGNSLTFPARMTGMDRKTARKYRDKKHAAKATVGPRSYRTRIDPFEDVWVECQGQLEAQRGLKSYALFEWLQEKYPGRFPDSTRRTFER